MGEIGRVSPEIVNGYRALGGAASKTSLLGAKMNELIALAVAVTVRCDGCISAHAAAASQAGATREEIVEALGTAAAVYAGSALVYSTRVLDALAAHTSAS
jgi:AhpD family alkylhydroperoxidase